MDPKLRNHCGSLPFQDFEEAPHSQKNLYELLLAKTRNPEAPYNASCYPIYPGWREYLDILHLFSRFYDQTGPLLHSRALHVLAAT
ncbi:MAG TPA: hypothetical protein VMW27_25305 [Thermoanaerobaculia bacterium]|nr:hypothetical protein [Thermoanaerobaculia bacterium]